MMKKQLQRQVLLLVTLFSMSAPSFAGGKERLYKFWVSFKDKKGSEYSVLRPWDFLSARSIARRGKMGFGVSMDDLPVNKNYIISVQEKGVKILLSSRWMNAVLVSTQDSVLAAQISALPMVESVILAGTWNRKRSMAQDSPDATEDYALQETDNPRRIEIKNNVKESEYNFGYGLGWKQINMIQGQALHQAGFKGKGVYIAVLDAGFYRADRMQAFDSLFGSDRYLGSLDLIDKGTGVFEDDDHGTQVLSCLASNVAGIMMGTAPEASYLLIRTEDAGSETLAEEAQWLVGAEYADSVGVDIISSSLGYTEFDDLRSGHKIDDLDGHTTIITRAANMAWDRGILVVNSAGNEGDERWKYIGAPADADGAIAVGAVDENGRRAGFSSLGPVYDGRVKPDLVALGKRTTIINSNGYYIRSNGTSYSAPVLAGAVACFVQAAYNLSPLAVRKMIYLSARQYLDQDRELGKGLPDFSLALQMLNNNNGAHSADNPFMNWPSDTISAGFDLKTLLSPVSTYFFKLTDKKGKDIASGSLFKYEDLLYSVHIEPTEAGFYTLEVSDKSTIWNREFYFAPQTSEAEK